MQSILAAIDERKRDFWEGFEEAGEIVEQFIKDVKERYDVNLCYRISSSSPKDSRYCLFYIKENGGTKDLNIDICLFPDTKAITVRHATFHLMPRNFEFEDGKLVENQIDMLKEQLIIFAEYYLFPLED